MHEERHMFSQLHTMPSRRNEGGVVIERPSASTGHRKALQQEGQDKHKSDGVEGPARHVNGVQVVQCKTESRRNEGDIGI